MIVGVDIDNVIADTEKELRRVLREEWGIVIGREDITDYTLKNIPAIGDEAHSGLMEMFRQGDIFLGLDVFEGARETLEMIAGKYELHLVTSRPPRVKEQTIEWLDKNGIPRHRLHFEEKSKLNGVDYELFIEDQDNFATELAESGAFVLLYDAPWNRHVDHVNIDRVFNWDDVRRFCFPPCAMGH